MVYKFSDKIDSYFEEYLTLILDFPEKHTFEVEHRRKMLREWLDNEIKLWETHKTMKNKQHELS